LSTNTTQQQSPSNGRSIRIGIDLGGSDVKFGATDLSGGDVLLPKLIKRKSLTHEGPDRTICQMLDGVRALLAEIDRNWTDVFNIAVTVPCPCTADGLILSVPNLGTPETKHLWEVPFGDLLAEEVAKAAQRKIPVYACNDANAAGQDEDFERFGFSTEERTNVFITTGTGLGGAVVINGRVFFGLGQAGELGHVKVAVPARFTERFAMDGNPTCGCGASNCVETRASLSGLMRRVGWALSDEGIEFIRTDLGNQNKQIDDAIVANLRERYQQDPKLAAYQVRTFADSDRDAFCRWLLDDWAIMIGALFASVAPVLHPNLFVIGGGLTEMSEEAKQWFLNTVIDSYAGVNRMNCFDSQPNNCEIDWSVSRDQGWRGAILMGMRAEK